MIAYKIVCELRWIEVGLIILILSFLKISNLLDTGGDFDGYDDLPRRPGPPMRGYGGGGGGGRFGGYDGGYDDYGGGYDDYGYGRAPMPYRGPRGRPGPYDRPPRPPRGDWNQGTPLKQITSYA